MLFKNILPTIMNLESISTEELNGIYSNEDVHIYDMNDAIRWQQNRIPQAVNLDPKSFTEHDLTSDKESTLIFYCSNPMCKKAPNAAKKVKALGYENVKVLSAGITGWMSDGYSVESGD